MGHQAKAKCRECGKTFTVSSGGGFSFHLLHCDRCGRTKSLGFDQLGDLHLRYLKGLPGSYAVAGDELDRPMREQARIEPISEDEYRRGVEAIAGVCRCGGSYSLDAPPRCPKCRSTQIDAGQITLMYD